jgi:uncharacterized phiE125 gp8 family phage protein
MAYKIITPADPVLTVAEVKQALRIDSSEFDAAISRHMKSATDFAEHETGVTIGQKTLEIALDGFPYGSIKLDMPPVVSIVSVTYVDESAVEQTLSPSLYSLDDYGLDHWLMPAAGTGWPATYEAANVVKVRYVAGSATPPSLALDAIILVIGHLIQNPQEATEKKLSINPFGSKSLLNPLWIPSI